MDTPSPNGHAAPAPTCREIFDWFLTEYPECRSRKALRERRRVMDLFCAYRGARGDETPYGDRPYTALRPFMVIPFLKAQPGLKSAWTRKRWATTLTVPFSYAFRMGFIDANPFIKLRMPMGKRGRDWQPCELQAMLRHSRPEFRRYLLFIRFTGARPGEAMAARWSHLDLENRVIVLWEHKTADKTGEARRIHLNATAFGLLMWIWRHAFATNALMNDVEITTVSSLLGHTSVSSTMRYSHLANKSPHLGKAAEQAAKPQARMRPAQLCREAALWAFARKPELRDANAVELHAYLLKTGWGPWLPANPRTFGQYLTPSRTAKDSKREGGEA